MTLTDKDKQILTVLKQHSCLTTTEIHNFIIKNFGSEANYSNPSISGSLRKFYSRGVVNKSPSPKGGMAYWLTDLSITDAELDKLN